MNHSSALWIGLVVFLLVGNAIIANAETRNHRLANPNSEYPRLEESFRNPPAEVRPWVCWFWWDGVLSREELLRELNELHVAGFGGAEIRCATFHGWSGPKPPMMEDASLEQLGQNRYEYLSAEFVDLLEDLCAEAEALDFQISLTLGQGWPPGGPWITDQHRSKLLYWDSIEIEGPADFESSKSLSARSMAFAWRLQQDGELWQVVADSFVRMDVPNQGGKVRWKVPAGKWLIGLFQVTPGGICDKGAGPEADPASKEAMEFQLDYFFNRIDPKLSRFYGKTLVDIATDSWEYHHGNAHRYWSPEIIEAFPDKTGYALPPKMYAFLGYGPDQDAVHADLERVEQELIHANFLKSIAKFAHDRNLGHRPQLYGRGIARDLLYAYTLADTPEVEHGILLPDAVWAARTTAKPTVSVEAYTFLTKKHQPVRRRTGLRETTPAMLRWHANNFFSEGINEIHFHSFGYSPPGVPLPGWRMYAEIQLGRMIPWWGYIRELNDWMARCQLILKAGFPVADALVYPVQSNPIEEPFRELGDHQPSTALNAIDGANSRTLPAVAAAAAEGRYETNAVCLIAAPESEGELKQLLTIVGERAKLIVCASPPSSWGFLKNEDSGCQERLSVLESESRLQQCDTQSWKELAESLRSVHSMPKHADLSFQHRRINGQDFYFLVNRGDAFDGRIHFPHERAAPCVWNADTGEFAAALEFGYEDEKTWLAVELDHFESAIVSLAAGESPTRIAESSGGMFSRSESGEILARFDTPGHHQVTLSDHQNIGLEFEPRKAIAIEGPWQIDVEAEIAGAHSSKTATAIEELVSWRALPQWNRFAGTAAYTTEFDLSHRQLLPGVLWQLELGDVFEVAEVILNGEQVGVLWHPPFEIDISPYLKPGTNKLQVNVANLLKNYVDSSEEYKRPSGLLGPVRLMPIYEAILSRVN